MDERFINFTMSVTHAYKTIQQIKKHESTSLGIKGIHIMCVYFLSTHSDGLTVTELSTLCCEDKAATSRTVDNLIKMGYITDHTANRQKRKWRSKLFLTTSGAKLVGNMKHIIAELINHLDYSFTAEEMKTFYKIFFTINDRLEKYCDLLKKDGFQNAMENP